MSESEPVRVGVVGVGALGQQHARVYAEMAEARLVGVHDLDPERSAAVAARHGCRAYEHLDGLLEDVEAVSVAVPTVEHHGVACRAIEAGRDLLVEKPVTVTLEQADDIIRRASERDVVLQVGHVERFNPAARALQSAPGHPRFVEVHRLSSFTSRSLDIDVVLDLMIHDLDVLLALERSEVTQVEAVGVAVLTSKIDVANARLRFESGLIANLTASRISAEKVRKFRIWAAQTYLSLDFAKREAQVYRLVTKEGTPTISVDHVTDEGAEPLWRQLSAFLASVRTRSPPLVSGTDGRRALALAQTVIDRIRKDGQTPGPWGR